MVVLGDRKQFGNVKTTNASKELNSAYFAKVKAALTDDKNLIDTELEVKTELLNIRNSIIIMFEKVVYEILKYLNKYQKQDCFEKFVILHDNKQNINIISGLCQNFVCNATGNAL